MNLIPGIWTPSWKISLKAPIEGGSAATDIDVMGEIGDEADEFTLDVKTGGDQGDVVEVSTAHVGIVDEQAVAGAEVVNAVGTDDAFGINSAREPRWTGRGEGLSNGVRRCLSKKAQEKSARVLMLVE